MTISLQTADSLALQAAEAIQAGEPLSRLDQIPVAAYATDRDGVVTYFNSSCPEFTGRSPQVGQDRWCVTHRLYTQDGAYLPHAECPMAEAIMSEQPIRGVTAVAERPDGTRVAFAPIPTPIFGKDGQLVGAINILVDVTQQQLAAFEYKSDQARRLAIAANDGKTSTALFAFASEIDAKAAVLRPK